MFIWEKWPQFFRGRARLLLELKRARDAQRPSHLADDCADEMIKSHPCDRWKLSELDHYRNESNGEAAAGGTDKFKVVGLGLVCLFSVLLLLWRLPLLIQHTQREQAQAVLEPVAKRLGVEA